VYDARQDRRATLSRQVFREADMTGTPEGKPAEPESSGAWPAWYQRFVVAGLLLSVALAAAAFVVGKGTVPQAVRVPGYLILPGAIAITTIAGHWRWPALLLVACLLIDVETLLFAYMMSMGLATAVLFPLIGLALIIDKIRGRALAATFVTSGLTAFAAIMLALQTGPVSQVQPLRDSLLVAAAVGAFIVYALGHLYRLNVRRTQALEAATAELESRRATEAELRRTSNLLAAIISSSPVPTAVLGPEGAVTIWNPAAERVFGWTSEETVGMPMPAAMTPEDERETGAERIRRILTGGVVEGERVRRLRKDGRELAIELYATDLRDRDGRTLGAVGQFVDVTERVTLEARLHQASRMEAIGVLAGGIAHDFNNILTAVRGYADLVRRGLPEEMERDRADLGEVVAAADKAAELTRQLLAFARRTVLEPRVLDPAVVVAEFVPMLRRLLGEDVELVLRLAPETGQIRVDPRQLEQVVLNLAVNARDAMPSGGQLEIETANVTVSSAYASSHPDARPGRQVRLSVSDTGIGMDPETRSHIFDPFFTTKEPGKGTGMGLATVFGIVQMSDGWIEVQSEPEKGARFEIFFPRLEEEAEIGAAVAPAPAVAHGSETVLLVEDDQAVRAYGRRCLSGLGYNVLEAPDGAGALVLAGSFAGSIDLLLTDVVMPGMQGPELSRKLREMRPGVRTLYCSGFAGDAVLGREDGSRGALLGKPYTRDDLAQAVRTALDRAN
jgi:two-component system cell cycle sensor histidine kinase/response regulator CckA